MKKIIIITRLTDIELIDNYEENVGILIEPAIDSELLKNFKNVVHLYKFNGNYHDNKKSANDLADKILKNEPYLRGVPQLTIFKEILVNNFIIGLRALHLHEYFVKSGFTCCEFLSHSMLSKYLEDLVATSNSSLLIITPIPLRLSRIKRIFSRILSSRFSLNELKKEFQRLLNCIDPFHRRVLFLNVFRNKKIKKNSPWFYTTAVTFTNIGLLYEPLFAVPFIYLVEDPLTGGRPLKAINHPFLSLYSFASLELIPSKAEISRAKLAVLDFINTDSFDFKEAILTKIFLNGSWFKFFMTKLLPLGLFYSDLFKNWIKIAEPSFLVVGNHCYEGYALWNAKTKNVKTFLLQHGLVTDTYHFTEELPINYFIIRGKFWYEILDAKVQLRSLVINPIQKSANICLAKQKPCIVFCTTPYDIPMGISIDLYPILTVLIQTIFIEKAKLIIRVHPLERVIDYQMILKSLLEKYSINIEIEYSQIEPLDTILLKASACVLFCSTVFIDCIKLGIPIISFDWIDYSYKKWLREHNVIYYALDLFDFKCYLTKGLGDKLPGNFKHYDFFIAQTAFDAAKVKLKECIGDS